MNLTNAATIVCESIYSNITETFHEDCNVTVNYYYRFEENGKIYSEMLGHEGYNTNPKFFKTKKLLKSDKNTYYCEKLFLNGNPEIVFLENEDEVKKAFKINKQKPCKYNQYVGIPIRRMGSSDIIALIEIVVHKDSMLWKEYGDVIEFVTNYCNPFKEYTLLIDRLSVFYESINDFLVEKEREDENGKCVGI